MELDAFKNLTEEEQSAVLSTFTAQETQISDLTAERDSLKEGLTAAEVNLKTIKTELAETKKLNFTLARQTSVEDKRTPEEYLKDIFGGTKT